MIDSIEQIMGLIHSLLAVMAPMFTERIIHNMSRAVVIVISQHIYGYNIHNLSKRSVCISEKDIRYTRFENCGQQDMKGRYCSHFHMNKDRLYL